MNKNLIIVGGGISGLTLLHYLKKKYHNHSDVSIKLFERQAQPGGTIRTIHRSGFQFETGPNGFLDSKLSTLTLANELGLKDDLIVASPATKIRSICVKNTLYPLPSGPISFFNFKPLSFGAKLRVIRELVIPRGDNPDETVYEFGTRRLGENFAKYFLDPMVSGIFGGNAQDLNLQHAFPRINQIEQQYGSLFRGMISLALQKKKQQKNSLTAGQPTGQLWSFKNGMGQLIDKIAQIYSDSIETGINVDQVCAKDKGYVLKASGKEYFADHLILSTPAYAAADIIDSSDKDLAVALRKIPYAAITVVGLVYSLEQFAHLPVGFGYLRPTHEGREVLGVLFSSNIFPSRSADGKILFQIMLGGACNPDTVLKSEDQLFTLAKNEIQQILQVSGQPQEQFIYRWDKGIPQYNRFYPQTYKEIKKIMSNYPRLHLTANYLDGVSLNDCIANAKKMAESIEI